MTERQIITNENGAGRIGVDPRNEDNLIPVWVEDDDNNEGATIYLSSASVMDLISALREVIA